ncbi:MAG: Rossmann-like and DUF2520 domain-containing protein [Actinomycetota bacterium]
MAILGRPVSDLTRGPGTIDANRALTARPTSVAIIGAGRVATALAVLLERAGHRVVAASGRERTRDRVTRYLTSTRFLPAEVSHQAARAGTVVILGVPDDLIAGVCAEMAGMGAFLPSHHVLHLSGSVGLEALAPARELGAEVLSLHPLQAFPSVSDGVERLPGSAIAVTAEVESGFTLGEALARDVGGRPFRLRDEVKPLYHAAAVFCSNYLVVVEAMAERLFRLAGLEEPLPLFSPLARSTLEATLTRGPGEALTGPAVRGDVGTIARNLEALAVRAPSAVPPYVALASAAAGLAFERGRLSPDDMERLDEVLKRWR